MGWLETFRCARLRDTLLSVIFHAFDRKTAPEGKREFLLRLLEGMINRNGWRG